MTLRGFLLGFGVALLLAAAIAAAMLNVAAIPLALFGAVLVVGILAERRFYKPEDHTRPGPGWLRTDERFIDPATGKDTRVFVRPDTGERRYVQIE